MLGFDTETLNREDGGQAVLLLRSDDKYMEFPKSFHQIFDFLKDGKTFVCWNMDFDARACIHESFIPYKVLENLAIWGKVRWKGYSIKYIPSKFLQVKKGKDSFTFYDAKQFYGLSLNEAAKKYLLQTRKMDIPKKWYSEMDKCLLDNRREKVIAYGLTDARACSELMGKIEDAFFKMGLKPQKWISPASLSVLYFKDNLETIFPLKIWHNDIFSRSFYGGRIEVGVLGRTGKTNLYDIHSAYPSVLAELKSSTKTHISMGKSEWFYNPATLYGSYLVEVEIPKEWYWGPLAVRQGSDILYPTGKIKTWIARPGLNLIRKLNLPFKVFRYLEISSIGDTYTIFPQIEELYLKRKDPGISIAVKLVLNSLYGKLAENRRQRNIAAHLPKKRFGSQKIGSREQFGRHTNYALAAHVTEATRLKVWEVLHKFGDKAFMAMTDSVLIRGEIPTGPALGEWGLKAKVKQAIIVGCGRYKLMTKEGDEHVLRGFSPSSENFKRIENCRQTKCHLYDLRTGSLVDWVRSCGVDNMNVLQGVRLDLVLKDTKRFWPKMPKKVGDVFKSTWKSFPYIMRQKERKNGRNSGRVRATN